MFRSLFQLLFGCAHSRTTFPATRATESPLDGKTRSQTRVTCLDCGKELAYDWDRMEVEGGGNRGRALLRWLRSRARGTERITGGRGDTR